MRIEGTLQKIVFNINNNEELLLILTNIHIRDFEDLMLKISDNNGSDGNSGSNGNGGSGGNGGNGGNGDGGNGGSNGNGGNGGSDDSGSNNNSIKFNLNNARLESITIGGEIVKKILEKADIGNKICLNLQLSQSIEINATFESVEIESED